MKIGEIKLQLHGTNVPDHKLFSLASLERLPKKETFSGDDILRADYIVSNNTKSIAVYVEVNVWKFSWLPSEWVAKDNEEASKESNRRMLQSAKQDVIISYFKRPGDVKWTSTK